MADARLVWDPVNARADLAMTAPVAGFIGSALGPLGDPSGGYLGDPGGGFLGDPMAATGLLAPTGPALDTTHDLETAILISLFTDHVAEAGDVLPPDRHQDPRGWWADTYETPDLIGSKLWQVMGRVNTQDTLNFARDTTEKALQWLIDDGVVGGITVVASLFGKGGLKLNIVLTAPTGAVTKFTYAWQQEI